MGIELSRRSPGKIRFVPFQLPARVVRMKPSWVLVGEMRGREVGWGSFGWMYEMDRFLVCQCWESVLYGTVLG